MFYFVWFTIKFTRYYEDKNKSHKKQSKIVVKDTKSS